MLNSLKKWVQDVTIDLTPPSSQTLSSMLVESNKTNSSSLTSYNEQQEIISSPKPSEVFLSRPMSMESVGSLRTSGIFTPSSIILPAELDLSHLNRDEQEHINNVLKRARAIDEQQSSSASSVVRASILSAPSSMISVSISPSVSSSSSSSSPSMSTNSCSRERSQKLEEKNININSNDQEM